MKAGGNRKWLILIISVFNFPRPIKLQTLKHFKTTPLLEISDLEKEGLHKNLTYLFGYYVTCTDWVDFRYSFENLTFVDNNYTKVMYE